MGRPRPRGIPQDCGISLRGVSPILLRPGEAMTYQLAEQFALVACWALFCAFQAHNLRGTGEVWARAELERRDR